MASVTEPKRRPGIERKPCPRCSGVMTFDGEYPLCVHCGYENYSYEAPGPNAHAFSRSFSVPYAGRRDTYRGVVVSVVPSGVSPTGIRNTVIRECPLECALPMTLIGEPEAGRRHYECPRKHVVELNLDAVNMGWR